MRSMNISIDILWKQLGLGVEWTVGERGLVQVTVNNNSEFLLMDVVTRLKTNKNLKILGIYYGAVRPPYPGDGWFVKYLNTSRVMLPPPHTLTSPGPIAIRNPGIMLRGASSTSRTFLLVGVSAGEAEITAQTCAQVVPAACTSNKKTVTIRSD
jgi:hypothetical protein